MASHIVTIRGEYYVVQYTAHGHEWDTGVHDIDWDFMNNNGPAFELTEDEEQAIYDVLVEVCQSIGSADYDFT